MANIKFSNTYSTAGLDVDGIAKIKEAIDAYVKKLEKLAEAFDTSKNADWNTKIANALKGSNAEAAAKTYVSGVCNECKTSIDLFKSLSSALDKLEEKYKNNEATNAKITVSATSVSVN